MLLGRGLFLPSTHINSRRHMMEKYQDSMAIARKFGSPDLFITVTCNPDWPEIKNELISGQNTIDRPDLVARVFNQKLDIE